MTPLRGILRRLTGQPAITSTNNGAAPPPDAPNASRARRNAASPATGGGPILTDTDGQTKRRRGRRGGRNRRRGETTSTDSTTGGGETPRNRSDEATPQRQAQQSGNRAEAPSEDKGRSNRGEYQWGRRVEANEADQRSRQANRRRRDVRSRNLDQPLPEDVAFRPGEEGGDTSILPSRRKRPVGFHDTARTLVGGARTVGTWVKRDYRHGSETPGEDDVDVATVDPHEEAADAIAVRARRDLATAEADEASGQPSIEERTPTDDSQQDEDDSDRPRRRRGRRGGRGRQQPDPETPSGDASTADTQEHDAPPPEPEDEAEESTRTPRRSSGPRGGLTPVSDYQIPAAFAALGIQRTTLEQLARFGFTEPTPIQVEAIPALLNGLDVVGIAHTGSGKTVAFGVPMVEKLDPELDEIQGIVLVPTRELAQQVLEVLADLARPWGLEAVGLLGGRSLKADFRALDERPHIVVGTPGRILDHLRRQTLSLRYVRYAVLDEADQMLDIGFLPDIRRILSRTPQRRQTALFSATMPGTIKRLIWQFMTDPETVRVDAEATPVETIEQTYFEVAQRDKVRAMRELIERELKGRTLIFCNMKRSVDHLARELERDGVRVRALHGDLDQRQRDRVVQEFRAGEIDALIATNVAARGLDIPEITHVVNYDVPQNLDEYVHRIGRTGRAGRDGKAITFVCEWDMEAFDAISSGISGGIAREELDLYGQR
ncbi:MAG: DEAD/DEAH box helicase [Chloroflexi bacterium]|nr:DEAD/DEAH box helicase [Chloroflexota bacterium]MQC16724.1 DEAD/DEAH box helicase [Chloroflexota bacterium]